MPSKHLLVLVCLVLSVTTLSARPKVALVLEGGGALGLAHVGVIQVIESLGIPVDIVVGTSMGSVVGGFYAAGYDARSLEAIAVSTPWGQLLTEKTPTAELSYQERQDRLRALVNLDFDAKGVKVAGGLLTGKRVVAYIDQVAVEASVPRDFDQFPRRFRAVATDVGSGERVVLSRGSLGDALRGSMGIPGLFSPYRVDGRYLVDGGIVSNLPIEVAKELGADLILAVHLTSAKPFDPADLERNPVNALMRSVDILVAANVQRQLPLADTVLAIDLAPYSATDFSKGADIIRLGRQKAEGLRADLEAFARKVGATVAPNPAPVPPVVRAVRIEGGTPAENAMVEAYFEPLVGSPARHGALLQPFFDLEEQTDFAAVRFRTEPADDGVTLVVAVTPKGRRDHAFRLNLLYQGTFSSAVSGHRVVAPGLVFRDITTPGSVWTLDAEIFDAPGIQTRFRQPLVPLTFAEAFYRFQQQSDVYLVRSTVSYQYQTSYNRTGLVVGTAPAPGLELTTGLTFDWLGASDLPEANGLTVDRTAGWTGEFHFQNTDSMAFPTQGVDVSLQYLQTVPALGSEGTFQVFQTSGSATVPLPVGLSASVLWRAGTDFSPSAGSPRAAPTFYKPSLADRKLFPGPLYLADRVGSHVAALGFEVKHRWDPSLTFGLPAYTLAEVSVGTVLQDPVGWDRWPAFTHESASLGLGLAVDDGHALVLQAGAIRKIDGRTLAFVSLDFGSGDF